MIEFWTREQIKKMLEMDRFFNQKEPGIEIECNYDGESLSLYCEWKSIEKGHNSLVGQEQG